MKTVKRQIVGMAAIVAVLLLLSGCGGGGEDEEDALANRSPSANAGPDQTVDAGSTVTLAGSGSDSDGSIARYQWTQTSGATVSLSNADQASASFVAPEGDAAVTLTFRLTVTDDDGAIARDDVSVTVEPTGGAGGADAAMVSLSGTVTDQSTGRAIPGAAVTVYQESASAPLGTTTTDATGAYEIQISAEPGRVTVKTESENFAPQAIVVDLEEGTSAASADLGNVPVGVSGVFQPTESIEVMGDGGEMLVSVPANSLVTASGADPAGMVSAEVTVLDASVDLSVMPGDFMAWNASTGKLQPIDSFGALDVRFEDGMGESLTLGSGQQARLWIPLAMNKDPETAPATMPLFYWSDERGHWIQDGTATLDRALGAYVGDVSHFTVWNVDEWVDTINVSVCVEDSAGNPVIGAWVYAQAAVDVNFNGWSAGRTDPPDGSLDLPVGQDLDIVLSVLEAHPFVRPRTALASRVFRTGSEDMTLTPCLVVADEVPANQPPSANAGPDQTVDAGSTVTLAGSGSDSDGSIARYQWAQTAGTTVSLSNANQASASFVAPTGDVSVTLTFRLTVTDDDGATASDEVSVTVQPQAPANQPPSANAGPDQTVDMGSVVMLIGSGTDPDGEIASYQWAQTGGPTVSLSVTDQALSSFVAPQGDTAVMLTFRFTVTDDDGEAVTDDVTVTVRAPGPFMLGTSKLDDPNFRLQ